MFTGGVEREVPHIKSCTFQQLLFLLIPASLEIVCFFLLNSDFCELFLIRNKILNVH